MFLSRFTKESPKFVKEAHNKALKNLIQMDATNPSSGLHHYLQLHWDVQSLNSGSLILGDAAVLYRGENQSKFSAGLGKGNLVPLPLSHDLLIFGAADPALKLPSPDEINRNSAELRDYLNNSVLVDDRV